MAVLLSKLLVYPVKSMRGLHISQTHVDIPGLAFDRILMITTPDGTFITARQYPQLVLFTPTLLPDGIEITAPDGESRTLQWRMFSREQQPTEVWGNHFTACTAPKDINQWLSGYMQRDAELRWQGNTLSRRVKNAPAVPLSFADGYPLLLTNEASLQYLQQRCPSAISMEQFRPNLVVSGAEAFAEDNWQTIRIGSVIFDVAKPCSRCILTTVNPEKGRKHPGEEPLNTLRQFRTSAKGNVDFGLNLIPRNKGVLRRGDSMEILATHPGANYSSGHLSANITVQSQPEAKVVIRYHDQTFEGNNQHTVLEQLEQQGINAPYSCRAGLCGCCKMKLESGEVISLKQGAFNQETQNLLICSCIPKSDITLV